MSSNAAQRSFAGGEIGPSLYGRTDQIKYQSGLRRCRNFIVQRHGGIANRPGLQFIAETKDSGAVRLVEFIFNDEQTYVLEFGERYVRFYRNGGVLIPEGIEVWSTLATYPIAVIVDNPGFGRYYAIQEHAGSTPNSEPGVGSAWQTYWVEVGSMLEVPTPYLASELSRLQFVQSGDILTIVHPNHAPRELQRITDYRWWLSVIAFGPAIQPVTNLSITGGAAGDDTYYAVTAIAGGTFEESLVATDVIASFIPSTATPITLSWEPSAGAIEYRVYRSTDGSTYGFVATAGGIAIPAVDSSWLGTSIVNNNTPGSTQGGSTAVNDGIVTVAGERAIDGKYRVQGSLVVQVTGGTSGAISQGYVLIYYKRGAETPVLAKTSASVYVVSAGTGTIQLDETIDVPDDGYTTLEIQVVAYVNLHADCTSAVGTFTGGDVEWDVGATGYVDDSDGVLDRIDYGQSPPRNPNLFKSGYPAVVGQYQQRRLLANTNDAPEKVWASQVGLYTNFSTSFPMVDSDAVVWQHAGRQVNEVRHLLDIGRLLVFTMSGVWIIQGDEAGILTPFSIAPQQHFYSGASWLRPIPIIESAIFVQARGSIVRDVRPDAIEGQRGNDLTIFAAHLFNGFTIVDWAYQENPNSVVWAVRSDGVLLGLTYIPEQAVWGWHKHDTDGYVENVCVVPEDNEDAVYLVVRREIDDVFVRYVERMSSRQFTTIEDAFFVDSGLTYDGTNLEEITMVLTGGTTWDDQELLTLTADASVFLISDLVNQSEIEFTESNGEKFRFVITSSSASDVAQGYVTRTVPVEFRDTVISNWAKAVRVLSGLDHLEGKAVSVLGDGNVVANPNRTDLDPVVVTSGDITLPVAVVKAVVGLPYLSDAQTLDIDSPTGLSVKSQRMIINRVTLMVETLRGIFAGVEPPSDDDVDPMEGLYENRTRTMDDEYLPSEPITDDIDINIPGDWNKNGRVFLRQLDPLPATILAVIPQGHLQSVG